MYVVVGWTTALLVVGIMVAVNAYVLDSFSQLSSVSTSNAGLALDPDAVQPARDRRRFYVVIAGEPPRHRGTTRLAEIIATQGAFEREQAALERRVDRILPDNLMFRVETPHGAVGYRKPAGVSMGVTTVTTTNGDVTIWVWYV